MKNFLLCLVLTPLILHTQQDGVAMPTPPRLPLITRMAPGNGCAPLRPTTKKSTTIFDTWRSKRRKIEVIPAKTPVVLLEELNVVYRPDIITVYFPVPRKGLVQGDTMLRYMYLGEGEADFWIKGRWYSDSDGGFIT